MSFRCEYWFRNLRRETEPESGSFNDNQNGVRENARSILRPGRYRFGTFSDSRINALHERENSERTREYEKDGRGHGERIFEDAFSRKAQRTGALPEYLRELAIYNRPLFLLPVSPVFNENNKTIVCPLPHPLPLESRSFLSPFHLAHTFFLPSLPSEKNWYYILSSLDFL